MQSPEEEVEEEFRPSEMRFESCHPAGVRVGGDDRESGELSYSVQQRCRPGMTCMGGTRDAWRGERIVNEVLEGSEEDGHTHLRNLVKWGRVVKGRRYQSWCLALQR